MKHDGTRKQFVFVTESPLVKNLSKMSGIAADRHNNYYCTHTALAPWKVKLIRFLC